LKSPSRSVVFVQNERSRIAFYAIAQRAHSAKHSAHTTLLAPAQRAPRRSAIFLEAVGTL